eukprot:scaffold595565_cov51-Prasinocladus_malaysianus.AAC.1
MALHPVGILKPKPSGDQRGTILAHGGPYKDSPEEFARFIRELLAMQKTNRHINGHFVPLFKMCGLKEGFEFDLYLKVEEIDVWYADLIQLLGFQEFVKSGWGSE